MIEAETNTYYFQDSYLPQILPDLVLTLLSLMPRFKGKLLLQTLSFWELVGNIFNIIGTLKLKLKSWLSEEY